MSNNIRIQFTDRLYSILEKLETEGHYVAFEMLFLSEPDTKYANLLKISKVDVGRDYNFKVTVEGKDYQMKVGKFIRYFFKGIFEKYEIDKFINAYNRVKSGKDKISDSKRINLGVFKFNPKDPRSTFLSLTTKTYPHGHEDEVLEFLPDLNKDKFGNYYKIIGDRKQTVMFTSHLDTADRAQKPTRLYSMEEDDGSEIIFTDGSSILGADDKAGVTIMLYMMAHNIPGLYYFFIGEERGGIGSSMLSSDFDSFDYLENIDKCISFDRRNTGSVITEQLGRVCCSNEFATALCDEYNKSGLNLSIDPGGIYTDSASFIDEIPECTNISVGYNNEHTVNEYQDMTFLEKICEASLSVKWNDLPVGRKVGLSNELVSKYRNLLQEVKATKFELETKIIGLNNYIYLQIDLVDADIESAYDTVTKLQHMLKKYRVKDDDVIVSDSYIKIELK